MKGKFFSEFFITKTSHKGVVLVMETIRSPTYKILDYKFVSEFCYDIYWANKSQDMFTLLDILCERPPIYL